MKYLSFLCLFCVLFHCNGQPKVIYRGANKILICDVQSRQITIVDSTLWANENLVHVEIRNDSLICLFNKSGEIFNRKYRTDNIYPLQKRIDKRFEHRIDHNSYYFHNFYFKDYRLILFSNDGMSLLKKDTVLWDVDLNYKFNPSLAEMKGQPSIVTGFRFPILSPDGDYFLVTGYRSNFFNSWAKLYEVNMSTGEKQLIERNAHNASYSPNGEYILFSRWPHGPYYIVDKKTKKKMFDYGFEEAFWLVH